MENRNTRLHESYSVDHINQPIEMFYVPCIILYSQPRSDLWDTCRSQLQAAVSSAGYLPAQL